MTQHITPDGSKTVYIGYCFDCRDYFEYTAGDEDQPSCPGCGNRLPKP